MGISHTHSHTYTYIHTQDLGDAFYTLFGGEDLVPSDLVAGMQLVRQWQKDTKQYSEENLFKNTKPLGM